MPEDKSKEILSALRSAGQKKYLDQDKISARARMAAALANRNRQEFVQAIEALGVGPETAAGRAHLAVFDALPRR